MVLASGRVDSKQALVEAFATSVAHLLLQKATEYRTGEGCVHTSTAPAPMESGPKAGLAGRQVWARLSS